MNFHVLTLFPEMIENAFATSITGKAMEKELIKLNTVNIRDFTKDKHNRVDDYAYGGGAGMLMQVQPVKDALNEVILNTSSNRRIIYVTPQGYPFTQVMAHDFAQCDDLIFLCGHYEGIDERALEKVTDFVSLGDYVLTGGELPALVMMDAISRLVPGVLGNNVSAQTESHSGYLLEQPQYSRPEVYEGIKVPDILLSGDTKRILAWNKEASIKRTKERRPDLYASYMHFEKIKERLIAKDKKRYVDVINLIDTGRARIVFEDEYELLLQNRYSHIYTHLLWDESAKSTFFNKLSSYEQVLFLKEELILHDESVITDLAEFGQKARLSCNQFVYTLKEKASTRCVGKDLSNHLVYRLLDEKDLKAANELWNHQYPYEYIEYRCREHCLFGAFYDDILIGVIGTHYDGAMGLLMVHKDYRRKGIGLYLLNNMINVQLERNETPYSHVIISNEKALALNEKAKMYQAKGHVFWLGCTKDK